MKSIETKDIGLVRSETQVKSPRLQDCANPVIPRNLQPKITVLTAAQEAFSSEMGNVRLLETIYNPESLHSQLRTARQRVVNQFRKLLFAHSRKFPD